MHLLIIPLAIGHHLEYVTTIFKRVGIGFFVPIFVLFHVIVEGKFITVFIHVFANAFIVIPIPILMSIGLMPRLFAPHRINRNQNNILPRFATVVVEIAVILTAIVTIIRIITIVAILHDSFIGVVLLITPGINGSFGISSGTVGCIVLPNFLAV